MGKSWRLYAEIDHTGVYLWTPTHEIELCPMFVFAGSHELEGRRMRRFYTNFSLN